MKSDSLLSFSRLYQKLHKKITGIETRVVPSINKKQFVTFGKQVEKIYSVCEKHKVSLEFYLTFQMNILKDYFAKKNTVVPVAAIISDKAVERFLESKNRLENVYDRGRDNETEKIMNRVCKSEFIKTIANDFVNVSKRLQIRKSLNYVINRSVVESEIYFLFKAGMLSKTFVYCYVSYAKEVSNELRDVFGKIKNSVSRERTSNIASFFVKEKIKFEELWRKNVRRK